MVKSILDDTINYPEVRKLDEDDRNYDATLYEIDILGIDVMAALGQSKYTFVENNVVYFPIYLVKDDKVDTQIGIYEALASEIPNITDADGDLELDKLGDPLLYSFVNKDLLAQSKIVKDEDIPLETEEESPEKESIEEESPEDKSSDDEVFEEEAAPLVPQTEELAEQERKDYALDKTQPWIQTFMKNNNFNIIDNEGGGDCLFAVIRDALRAVDKDVTVKSLRAQLSEEVTDSTFNNYLEHYMMYSESIKDDDIELKKLVKENRDLRRRLKETSDRQEQLKIVDKAKEVSDAHKRIKNERDVSRELLREFTFMKNVKTIDDFKKKINSCEFWADTWAISTLERILNVKLILFSQESFEHGDINNVLQCGQLNDNILEEKGRFEPTHYILTAYTGYHYMLITYKNHRIFTFEEIPHDIKLLVANKCLERQSGPYYIIPQFRVFNEKLGITIEEPIEEDVEVLVADSNALYDDDTILQYYARSNDKPLPGKGTGEKIKKEDARNFSELAAIPKWRKKLSNFWEAPFDLDGHKWQSVEHYYQGSKFKQNNPEFYLQFSLDSETKLSKDSVLAKAAGSKSGKHKGELLRPKSVAIDADFFGGRNDQEMKAALYAKFSQNSDLTNLLLSTNNAKIVNFRRGLPADTSTALMNVRKTLRDKQ